MAVLSRVGVRRAVLAAGTVAAVGVAAAQPPTRPPAPPVVKPVSFDATAVTPAPAADPLPAMLAEAKAAHARLRDYACTYTRQERVNGVLQPEQVAEMRVRVQPGGLYLRFVSPPGLGVQELAYQPHRRGGQVRAKGAAVKSVAGFVSVPKDDARLAAVSRRAVTETGIGPLTDGLAAAVAREKGAGNPVEAFASDYQFAGRAVTRYDVYTRRPHAHRAWFRAVVYVDKELKLPVRWECYDQPKPGGPADGELLEAYSFSDLRVNVGLGETAFDY